MNTKVTERCISIPPESEGEMKRVMGQRNEKLQNKKGTVDWGSDSKDDSEADSETDKNALHEGQRATTNLVQRMTNDTLKTPSYKSEGILRSSDILHFHTFGCQNKKEAESLRFSGCVNHSNGVFRNTKGELHEWAGNTTRGLTI